MIDPPALGLELAPPSVLLVSMPWGALRSPSIQIGTLKSVLDGAGIPATTGSYHLQFMEHLARHTRDCEQPFTAARYDRIADTGASIGGGDFAFAVPPFRELSSERDTAYRALLESMGVEKRLIDDVFRVRELVPSFLAQAVGDVASQRPAIVGFTTTFGQNVSSLVLAMLLKQALPDVRIVFGGANCDGDMGEALLRRFACVDVVVRGEAEAMLPQLMTELAAGEPPSAHPGLCYRSDGECVIVPFVPHRSVAMDDVPTPDYDEFFDRLDGLSIQGEISPDVRVPFESSRGCWWGAKSHCTFCGLNGSAMSFRAKSVHRVLGDLHTLAQRHHRLDFSAVDNIIDMSYFRNVLPTLAEQGLGLTLFYETKANLTRSHVQLLFEAGVRSIQPGIESLSNSILKRMRKGVTALQNIRLLKWCAERRIEVLWNIIYGIPGEDPDDYARMAGLIPQLVHLHAPHITRLRIDRFSPYFESPEAFGLMRLRPKRYYGMLYDGDPEPLAYHFDADYANGIDPDGYAEPACEAVDAWRRDRRRTYRSLTYRVGSGFLSITDARRADLTERFTLDRRETLIYLACDAGARPAQVVAQLEAAGQPTLSEAAVTGFLDELCAAGLVYQEDGKYLGLALSADPTARWSALLASSTGPESRSES